MLAAGLIDEVRMDVIPRRVRVLEDPDVAIRGNRVLHLRCPVR